MKMNCMIVVHRNNIHYPHVTISYTCFSTNIFKHGPFYVKEREREREKEKERKRVLSKKGIGFFCLFLEFYKKNWGMGG